MTKKYVSYSVIIKLRKDIQEKIDLMVKYLEIDNYSILDFDKGKILQEDTFISFSNADELKCMCEWADTEGLHWNSCSSFMESFDSFSESFLYSEEAINFKDGVWGDISEFKKEYKVLTFNDVILR